MEIVLGNSKHIEGTGETKIVTSQKYCKGCRNTFVQTWQWSSVGELAGRLYDVTDDEYVNGKYHDRVCDSQVPPFLKSYYKEKAAFESGKCPYCGSTDNRTKTCSEKQLKKEEKEAFEAAEKRVNTFFESVKNKNSQATASAETKNLSTENTKKFLLTAFNLEDNIFSLKKRLADLYVIDANLQAECDVFLWSEKRTQQIELEKLQEEYKLLQNYDFKKDIAYVAFSSDYPVWNEEQPAKPAEPSLKKAGLFNKKRVRLENENILNEYKEKLAAYEAEYRIYELRFRKHQEEVERIKAEDEEKSKRIYCEKLNVAKERYERELERKASEIEKLKKSQEEYLLDIEDQNSFKSKIKLIEKEKQEAEDLIQNTYAALTKLYGYNVLYDKYCNYVAVSKICDYFASGRAEMLQGPNGAYNLYESERRSDLIISKLSDVLNSLEQIKENQYLIYRAIHETNAQLNDLKVLTAGALLLFEGFRFDMQTVAGRLEKIKTAQEMTAYNTAVTAYYAKKNAELTNALGYMVALS